MSDIVTLTRTDDTYPPALRGIEDAPRELYVRGMNLTDMPNMVAIVGSRSCTAYGEDAAYRLGGELARLGFTVVSGMASGVDGRAHQGALDAGGLTVAVLGCGPDVCYPKEHAALMDKLPSQGAIVSEYPPGTAPAAYHFPRRNRIISGLSLGLVVVEAALKSGTQITVRHARQQGRKIMAVPGSIFSPRSGGTNELIRHGAALVACGKDVAEALGVKPPAVIPPRKQKPRADVLRMNEAEQRLSRHIGHEPLSVDELTALSGLPVREVLAAISMLEISGVIRQTQGARYIRANQ